VGRDMLKISELKSALKNIRKETLWEKGKNNFIHSNLKALSISNLLLINKSLGIVIPWYLCGGLVPLTPADTKICRCSSPLYKMALYLYMTALKNKVYLKRVGFYLTNTSKEDHKDSDNYL
jgi:hypothetical protein